MQLFSVFSSGMLFLSFRVTLLGSPALVAVDESSTLSENHFEIIDVACVQVSHTVHAYSRINKGL